MAAVAVLPPSSASRHALPLHALARLVPEALAPGLLPGQVLDLAGPAIVRTVAELALEGDPFAMKLCLERLIPLRMERPVKLSFDRDQARADPAALTGALLTAAVTGDIETAPASNLAKLIETHALADEVRRLRAAQEDIAAKDQRRVQQLLELGRLHDGVMRGIVALSEEDIDALAELLDARRIERDGSPPASAEAGPLSAHDRALAAAANRKERAMNAQARHVGACASGV